MHRTALTRTLQIALALLTSGVTTLIIVAASDTYSDWPEIASTEPFVMTALVLGGLAVCLVIIAGIQVAYYTVFNHDTAKILTIFRFLRVVSAISAAIVLVAFVAFTIATGVGFLPLTLLAIVLEVTCLAGWAFSSSAIARLHDQ